MFMYLAFWSSHWPLHVDQEYIDRYDGVYDKGWDEIRKERFELQKEMGIIPESLELPPRLDKVVPWDDLTPEQQEYEAKKMQTYAGMTERMDENIGRLLDHLKEIDEYDNTLIFIFSDNGAESSDPTKKLFSGDNAEEYDKWFEQFDNSLENIGTDSSLVSIGLGWAQVGSTPLYREKIFETEGGTRVPMIVKLPGNSDGFTSNAFSHVQDLGPTVLEYAGVEHPGNFYNDREVHEMNGKSLKSLFDGESDFVYAEDEPMGAELFGNKALYKGDWKILSLLPPIGDGEWKLFNLAEDIRELNDLSSENPELFQEMISDYDDYADRVGVIPPEGLELPR
jgi:arylsulfatase A-like enzyme